MCNDKTMQQVGKDNCIRQHMGVIEQRTMADNPALTVVRGKQAGKDSSLRYSGYNGWWWQIRPSKKKEKKKRKSKKKKEEKGEKKTKDYDYPEQAANRLEQNRIPGHL